MTTSLLSTFRDRLRREAGPRLWQEIERAANERLERRGEHAEWALLAEEAGLFNLAFREFQLALRDEELASTLGRLRLLLEQLQEVNDLERVRGLEGMAAALYFRAIRQAVAHTQPDLLRPQPTPTA